MLILEKFFKSSLYLGSFFLLAYCTNFPHLQDLTQKTAIYADHCQNPREKITLNPDGTGFAELVSLKKIKKFSWEIKDHMIHFDDNIHRLQASINSDQHMILESSSRDKNKNIPLKDRIRYRCF